MTAVSELTAGLSARAPEAATGGPRSAPESAQRPSGSAAWPGRLAPAIPVPSGDAFMAVLARLHGHAAEAPVSGAADRLSDDAALDEEPEAARPDDAALRALAALIGSALPAASQQGIGVLSVGQGEAMRALGVSGAAAPAPDSLQPGSRAATVGIEASAAAQGPGSAPGIAPRRAASAAAGAALRAPPAPGSSAGASRVPTVGSTIGPAAAVRAEAARPEVAPEGPPGSPSPARENASDAAAAARAVSAPLPTTASVAVEAVVPAEPVEPELGAAVSAAAPRRPGPAPRATDGGRPSPDEAGPGELSSRPEQGAGRASAGDPSLRVAVGPELGAAVPAAAPRRPGAALRAADGGRPSPDEAGPGEPSSRPEQEAGRARAVDPVPRVAPAPVDRAPRWDGADGLGEGGPETGDGLAVAVVGPGQPAAAGEAKASQAEPGVSARSAAEQIAAEIAERLGLLRRPGRHEISLELRPDNLGTVHLSARLEGRQLTLEIRAELAQSRELLQQALPQLRELLVQQGIDAGRVTINLGLDTAARDFSGQHFGAPRHFMRDEALPGAPAPAGAPVRRRQPGPTRFDFWV